jgi:hypothetical protein
MDVRLYCLQIFSFVSTTHLTDAVAATGYMRMVSSITQFKAGSFARSSNSRFRVAFSLGPARTEDHVAVMSDWGNAGTCIIPHAFCGLVMPHYIFNI